ncbi:hypothetical protein [Pontixanthobacter gangjinensis]|nr:hypothetical protein [Pontixanthobacter gangjinensis]
MKVEIARLGLSCAAVSLAVLTVPLTAQNIDMPDASQAESNGPAEIIVEGEAPEKKEVLVGSRIPRRAVFTDGIVATSMGTRGLVPQSGMDQGATVRTIKRRECKSDDPAIGKAAACLLLEAKAAIELADYSGADGALFYLADSEEFTAQERLAGAQWRYRLAGERGDAPTREDALEQMVETGAMNAVDQAQAQRALSTMARRDGRLPLARRRLLALDASGQAQTQDLANLAIMTRALDLQGAETYMNRAIIKRESGGGTAPKGWHDFVSPQL